MKKRIILQGNIMKNGDFVLEIKPKGRTLELISLEDVRKRNLRETGELTFAIASHSSYFSATTIIPEKNIPLDAIAFRIGNYLEKSNGASGETEVLVPVAFYAPQGQHGI